MKTTKWMARRLAASLAIATVLVAAQMAQAGDKYWVGSGDPSIWGDSGSWYNSSAPANSDNVYFRSSAQTINWNTVTFRAVHSYTGTKLYLDNGSSEENPFIFVADQNDNDGYTSNNDVHLGFNGSTYGDGWLKILGGKYQMGFIQIGEDADNPTSAGHLVLDATDHAVNFTCTAANYGFKLHHGTVVTTNATVSVPLFYVGDKTNSRAFLESVGGSWTVSSSLQIAYGDSSTGIVDKQGGGWSCQTIQLAGNNNATATFKHSGGWLTTARYGLCIGCKSGSSTHNALFELSGGAVTNTGGNVIIGDNGEVGSLASLHVTGGELCARTGQIQVGSNMAGVLEMDGGDVIAPNGVRFCVFSGCISGEDCFLNLNGGTLAATTIDYGSGAAAATFKFDGGTLKAKAAGTLIQAHNNLTVTVAAGGGTIDSGNYAITIAEDLGGTGGMTFSGGSTITLGGAISYTGGTTVEAGTVVVVPDVASCKALGAISVTGLGHSVCEVVRLSGEGTFSAGDLPADIGGTTFRVSPDGKSILAANGMETAFWIGGNGDLGTASNWSGGSVPTGNPVTISWMSPIALTNSGTFAPSSITFDGPASVTIDGDDITSVVAVTNLSSVSHTINAKVYFAGDIQVKQAAMAGASDLSKAHVTFAGGAYAASGCSLENGNFDTIYSRCIFGKYYLASTAENPWTVYITTGNRNALAADSSLYIPYAGDMRELYIASGAKVDIGNVAMSATGSFSLQNYGEMVVTNVTMTSTGDRHMSYRQGTGTPGMFKFNSVTNEMSSNWFYLADSNRASKHVFYIGEGGLNYSHDNAVYCLGRDNDGNHETIRPWYSDFTIADRGNSGGALAIRQKVEFCTDDENDVGRTITINAITKAESTPAITVSGKGTLQVNNGNVNSEQPPVTVKDTATLAFGENGSLGTGAITLGAGTTLALTAASSSFTPLVNAVTLPTGEDEKVILRIDGARLKSGPQTILSNVIAGATANVELDRNSPALAGRKATLAVDGSNLVLTIEPGGMILIVR